MNNETATKLLDKIELEKKAEPSLASQVVSRNADRDALRTLAKALALGLGGGAAIRGLTGLGNLFEKKKKPVPSTTIDMDMPYLKAGHEKSARSKYNVDWFLPAMLLGTPLAAYGGWKGVDMLMDDQRKKRTEGDLEDAKREYQQALLGSYDKQASDEPTDPLGDVFDAMQKQADEGWLDALKNMGVAYSLFAAPAGYMLVNNMMKKNSRRALLQKAQRERARRRAMEQPAELYAIPSPKAIEGKGSDED